MMEFPTIDGKHVVIICPKHGCSLYFNYKDFHSIILFALVDANYKYMWVDVGSNNVSAIVFLTSGMGRTCNLMSL